MNDATKPSSERANAEPTQGAKAKRTSSRMSQDQGTYRITAKDALPPELATDQANLIEREGVRKLDKISKSQGVDSRDVATKPATEYPSKAGNAVVSDEILRPHEADRRLAVPDEVNRRYLRIGTSYYHRKRTDFVAFEDKGNKLETRSDSENIAETMVAIARSRGWDEIKVSGSETFRRMVWIEGTANGMQVKGYRPNEVDKAELAKRTPESIVSLNPQPMSAQNTADGDRQAKHLARMRADSFERKTPAEATAEHPELAGTYAAIAAMENKARSDNLSPEQMAVVRARIRRNIVNSIERGDVPQVQLRERSAPTPQQDREREALR